MQNEIHPEYHKNAKVQCACGNEFNVGSTEKLIEVEICSECHPFYTGEEKVVDKQGQIQKFKDKYGEEE